MIILAQIISRPFLRTKPICQTNRDAILLNIFKTYIVLTWRLSVFQEITCIANIFTGQECS